MTANLLCCGALLVVWRLAHRLALLFSQNIAKISPTPTHSNSRSRRLRCFCCFTFLSGTLPKRNAKHGKRRSLEARMHSLTKSYAPAKRGALVPSPKMCDGLVLLRKHLSRYSEHVLENHVWCLPTTGASFCYQRDHNKRQAPRALFVHRWFL